MNNVERVQLPKTMVNGTGIRARIYGAFLPVDKLQRYAFIGTGAIVQIAGV